MKDLDIILKKIYDKVKKIKGGKNASYIPELAKVDPKIYSISICDVNGNIHNIGDYKKEVAIESVAKVFTLSLAIEENGLDNIRKKIGSQGSFYHLIL
jgi:glutaminase